MYHYLYSGGDSNGNFGSGRMRILNNQIMAHYSLVFMHDNYIVHIGKLQTMTGVSNEGVLELRGVGGADLLNDIMDMVISDLIFNGYITALTEQVACRAQIRLALCKLSGLKA